MVFGSGSGFGTAVAGRQVIDLTTLIADQGFIIQGDAAGDQAGHSVSSAGDVNGDGFHDLIVGAFRGDDGGNDAGEAYVVFGSGTGFGTSVGGRQVIDLDSLTATQGFIIQGDTAFDQAGASVSSAGDVNGDGFDDLIVGAPYVDNGSGYAGEAYVVLGSGTGFGTPVGDRQVIDLTTLTATQGFIILGETNDGRAGRSVSSAGDVNGDGFDDVIVGAPLGYSASGKAGEAYVVFGSGSGFGTAVAGRQVIDLTTLIADEGFIIQGDRAYVRAGYSVSSAGDVNGDGFEDLIVGVPSGNGQVGEAYVVFGSGTGFGTSVGGRQVIDLASLTATQGFIIQGDTAFDQAGASVSSAGDVNGDGFDDLIVGAFRGDDGGNDAGEAYVVFGSGTGFGTSAGGRQIIDLTSLTASQGFLIQGDQAGDEAGHRVSSAGDVNGDGFDDLIVGASRGDDGGNDAGEAYVILGGAFGSGSTPVSITGTAGAEMLIGGVSDDNLTGGGGADVMRGGAGDDMLGVSDSSFFDIDGGNGYDTLRVDGSNLTFDFSVIHSPKMSSIEAIDLTGTGDNHLILDLLDLFQMSDDTSGGVTRLAVWGDAGDTVSTLDTGWSSAGTTVIGENTFSIFQKEQTQLIIHADIFIDGMQL